MQGNASRACTRHQRGTVVARLRTRRPPTLLFRDCLQHCDCRVAFGVVPSRAQIGSHDQRVPVIYQHASEMPENSGRAVALARSPRIRKLLRQAHS